LCTALHRLAVKTPARPGVSCPHLSCSLTGAADTWAAEPRRCHLCILLHRCLPLRTAGPRAQLLPSSSCQLWEVKSIEPPAPAGSFCWTHRPRPMPRPSPRRPCPLAPRRQLRHQRGPAGPCRPLCRAVCRGAGPCAGGGARPRGRGGAALPGSGRRMQQDRHGGQQWGRASADCFDALVAVRAALQQMPSAAASCASCTFGRSPWVGVWRRGAAAGW
jgi:hypothetical protein